MPAVAGCGGLGWFLDVIPYAHAPLVEAALGKRALVLDVGGGTGRVARRLSAAQVVVVDPSRRLLSRARRKRLAVVRADARFLPFRAGCVPAVVMVDALHHMPEHERVLAETRRVLAPDGRLVVEEFDPRTFGGRMIEAMERVLAFGSVFRSPPDLADLARRAGFEARVERWDGKEYALVADPRPP